MFLRLLFLFVLLFLTSNAVMHAQVVPVISWDKSFGGNDADELTIIKPTTDGGYILGGRSFSDLSGDKSQPSQGNLDYWVVKTDANGNKVWDKTFGGANQDYLYYLQQTSDGGYILGGHSNSGISGNKTQASKGGFDYWIVKLDSAGNKVWDKTYGGLGGEALSSIFQTSEGGYWVGGGSTSNAGGDKSHNSKGSNDFWIIRLDANGNKVWDKTIGGNESDGLITIIPTTDNGVILGGQSKSGVSGDKSQASKGYTDYWVVKLDSIGNQLWDRAYGGDSDDLLGSILQTHDGGLVLSGTSFSGLTGDKSQHNKGHLDYWVIKLDSAGTKVWDKTLGGNDMDWLSASALTSDGGYIFGGSSHSNISYDKTAPSKGREDFWIVKLDSSGNTLWDKTLGGSGADQLLGLFQTVNGGYLLGGFSDTDLNGDKTMASKGFSDYWLVKLESPCLSLNATFGNPCPNEILSVNFTGLLPGPTGMAAWELEYSENGVIHTVTGFGNVYDLNTNAIPGTAYTLLSLVSGVCSVKLNQTLTIPSALNPPSVVSASKCGSGAITLSATGAPSVGSYVWYDSATGGTPVYTDTSGTFLTPVLKSTKTYYVAVTNENGCEGERTAVNAVIINIEVEAGEKEIFCSNSGPAQLTGFSPAGGIWSGTGVTASGIFSPSDALPGVQTLTYTVVENGCNFSGIKLVETYSCESIKLPNIITPNNDDKNDTFSPQNLPAGKWNLQILNRWGFKIYESEDYQNNWPKTKISDGTYYYLLRNPETGQQFKGWVEVVQ